ncbi:hypothetical protein GO988_01715 [Hymenobacter sp. HMF4947]|uniref:Uncharacterized protein n=1 Tax=Hymenobacter ginkgonis TaxID=2682976 RepID=A0A7K1T9E9_9BACT|nr:hypothetical protein [Hymenobacter ginkgonis]MVN75036.1 hypothetical protein [Hymenobacter ginkgonis]
MTASEFWDQQDFSYLVTYSFNRGPKRTELIQQTKRELQIARFMRRPKLLQRLQSLEAANSTLIEEGAVFHSTATVIAQINSSSIEAQQVKTIFRNSAAQQFYAGCIPIYRDALVFYSEQGEMLGVLNICFECFYMKTDVGLYLEADVNTYQALRGFLTQLGHPIEDQ